MDFPFVLRAEGSLRPGCVPWELHGAEMSGGTVQQQCVTFQFRVRNAPVAVISSPPLTSRGAVR